MGIRAPGPVSPARVRLVPMTDAEYERFTAFLVPDYAEQNVAAEYWEPGSALERARTEITQLLPQGRRTPDHHFFTIRRDADDAAVGSLWFAVRRAPQPAGGFIYDIVIDAAHRRQGYAGAAMLELENVAKGLGVDRISLHVFGSNSGAIDLYRKLGYQSTSLLMRKRPIG